MPAHDHGMDPDKRGSKPKGGMCRCGKLARVAGSKFCWLCEKAIRAKATTKRG